MSVIGGRLGRVAGALFPQRKAPYGLLGDIAAAVSRLYLPSAKYVVPWQQKTGQIRAAGKWFYLSYAVACLLCFGLLYWGLSQVEDWQRGVRERAENGTVARQPSDDPKLRETDEAIEKLRNRSFATSGTWFEWESDTPEEQAARAARIDEFFETRVIPNLWGILGVSLLAFCVMTVTYKHWAEWYPNFDAPTGVFSANSGRLLLAFVLHPVFWAIAAVVVYAAVRLTVTHADGETGPLVAMPWRVWFVVLAVVLAYRGAQSLNHRVVEYTEPFLLSPKNPSTRLSRFVANARTSGPATSQSTEEWLSEGVAEHREKLASWRLWRAFYEREGLDKLAEEGSPERRYYTAAQREEFTKAYAAIVAGIAEAEQGLKWRESALEERRTQPPAPSGSVFAFGELDQNPPRSF
jgi:hypothetical protein